MKNAVLFLLIFFMYSNCLIAKYHISDSEQAVNNQMNYSAKMLAKKYNIRPCGTTVAMPEGNIQYLELEFDVQGPVSKNAIRRLLMNSVHDFLDNINKDTALCSCLKNGCLDILKVGVSFFFFDSMHRPIERPEIGVAFIESGHLTFITLEPEALPSFRDQMDETYEEALRILQS